MKKGSNFGKRAILATLIGFTIGTHLPKNKNQSLEQQIEIEDTTQDEIHAEPYKKEIPKHLRKEYQTPVDIPGEYYEEIVHNSTEEEKNRILMNNEISEGSLYELKKLRLNPTIKDLDFFKYCTNLEYLHVSQYDEEVMKALPELPSVKKIAININEFNNKTKELLNRKMPNIKEMDISCTLEFEPDVIEKMKNLKKLTIGPKQNCDIDFKKLTNLEELKISSTEPYNIAIWLNKEEYLTLKENGVKITFAKDIENKYLEILEKIENIIKKLNIDKNNTDKEKYNKIITYILENMKYDEKVIEMSEQKDKDENALYELIRSFYKDGMLYASLEKDTQICGNYSALLEALCDRIYKPEQAYMLKSETHTWNIIKLDEMPYYVDATWLDDQQIIIEGKKISATQAIEEGYQEYLLWYLENPESEFIELENGIDECHIPKYTPEYFAYSSNEPQKVKKIK